MSSPTIPTLYKAATSKAQGITTTQPIAACNLWFHLTSQQRQVVLQALTQLCDQLSTADAPTEAQHESHI